MTLAVGVYVKPRQNYKSSAGVACDFAGVRSTIGRVYRAPYTANVSFKTWNPQTNLYEEYDSETDQLCDVAVWNIDAMAVLVYAYWAGDLDALADISYDVGEATAIHYDGDRLPTDVVDLAAAMRNS